MQTYLKHQQAEKLWLNYKSQREKQSQVKKWKEEESVYKYKCNIQINYNEGNKRII